MLYLIYATLYDGLVLRYLQNDNLLMVQVNIFDTNDYVVAVG